NAAAVVRLPWLPGVVDHRGHLLSPCEVLAKAVRHALGDGNPARGRLALQTLLLWALDVGLDVISHGRHCSKGLAGTDGLGLLALVLLLRDQRCLRRSPRARRRSEEHTSELQSRGHLVCRLLRE